MVLEDVNYMRAFTKLCCPLDGDPLTLHERTWRCPHGHSFDVAKQGYVNLLPVQNKRSKDPGDSKAMVQARSRFLAQGFYAPLAERIAEVVWRDTPVSLLDAGCGEGYYLREILAARPEASTEVAALDISKWAVLSAAKSLPSATLLVASNSSIPVASSSVDTLLCLFGFPVSDEFQRVLTPGGRVLMVDPAPNHLRELKEVIYDDVRDKPDRLPLLSPWSLVNETRVTFQVALPTRDAVTDLLIMTPHLYRASRAGRERAEALNSLTITVDAWLREFRVCC